MWVMGGLITTNDALTGQMFSIDLSTSWNTSSPVYKRLPDGLITRDMASALMADNKNWFILSNSTAYKYNLATSSWSTIKHNSNFWGGSTHAATDPETGEVYVPNGYDSLLTGDTMLSYKPYLNEFYYHDKQPNLEKLLVFSVAWSAGLRSMLLFGGEDSRTGLTNNDLYAYNEASEWRLLSVKGDIPSPRRSSCFVPAYQGTKMVLFGGLNTTLVTLGDIYILDVATLTWSRGPDGGLTVARYESACAVTNDYFISWGGGNDIPANLATTVVYNIKAASWTTNFEGSSVTSPTESLYVPPPLNSGGPGSTRINLPAVIGGSVAAVVVVVVAVALILRKRISAKPSEATPTVVFVTPDPLPQPTPVTYAYPEQPSQTQGQIYYMYHQPPPQLTVDSTPVQSL
ncbi:Acyl-CoA-binding domain-containing protein 5 [Linnemannia gamsii]|uniref:Acyl-CoA-binding domain-containing protein 5 n=1 Tax=Linnemannia gamsii TaxID=64522 RepID=A0ABQ7JTC2_9FUNG|nr:Acyl-CoA-binding domain-containing protein 5 [Linnemannia gamsii]